MNLIGRHAAIYSALLFALTSLSVSAIDEQTFFEKELEVHPNLYKISAPDLQAFLEVELPETPTISAEELKEAMAADPDLCVINVLPPSIHNDCHITGSMNVPLKEIVDAMGSWNRDKEIIVYCALYECDAGEKAYILLTCMGFTNVTDYNGGIKEWYQLDYPTQGPATYSFLHTKAFCLPEDIIICSSQLKKLSTENE